MLNHFKQFVATRPRLGPVVPTAVHGQLLEKPKSRHWELLAPDSVWRAPASSRLARIKSAVSGIRPAPRVLAPRCDRWLQTSKAMHAGIVLERLL